MQALEKKFAGKIFGIKKRLGAELALAGIALPPEKYVENSFKWSVVFGIFFWVVFSLAFENLFLGFFLSGAVFAGALLFCAYYPVLLKKSLKACPKKTKTRLGKSLGLH